MSTVEPPRLDELARLAAEATPGPWPIVRESCDCGGDYPCGHGSWHHGIDIEHGIQNEDGTPAKQYGPITEIMEFKAADIAYLAAADPSTVAELVAELRALRAALVDALEGLQEMLPYVSDYFVEKWDLSGYVERAEAALAALGEPQNPRETP